MNPRLTSSHPETLFFATVVIPAKAGIQLFQGVMDTRLREDDYEMAFLDGY